MLVEGMTSVSACVGLHSACPQAPTSLPLSKSLKGRSGTEPVRSLGAGRLIKLGWAKRR